MPTYYIIANPVAGEGAGRKAIPIVEECLKRHGVDYHLDRTEHQGHGIELARKAAPHYDVVAAVGGDGTVNEVLNGLVVAKQEGSGDALFGIVGAGRGNDLAASLGIPEDQKEACELLLKGRSRPIDIGRVTAELAPVVRLLISK